MKESSPDIDSLDNEFIVTTLNITEKMSTNLDKSLDDIISSKKKTTRRSAGGVRKASSARPRAAAKVVLAKKERARAAATRAAAVSSVVAAVDTYAESTKLADRVIISNLVGACA
jgi:hypothetical protein